MMITVRRATLLDKDAIFEFSKLAYKGRWQYKVPERWQWEYVDNPFLEGQDLPVYIAVDEQGKVVGQTCTLVEPLKVGEKVLRVGWSVDTFLLPEYRGQGLGFQLQKANDEGNPIFMSLSMSKANRRIKAGLGSIPVDPVPSYTRLLRYTPQSVLEAVLRRAAPKVGRFQFLLNAAMHWTMLDRLAAGLLNLKLGWVDKGLMAKIDPDIQISSIDQFGPEIDHLWQKTARCFHAVVVRDERYLNWKYVRQPHMDYKRFIARRGSDICGYVILRSGRPPERNMGILADLWAEPRDGAVIHALLVHSLRYFKKVKAKDISAASTVKEYQDGLEALGFKKSGELYPMLHCKLEGPEFDKAKAAGAWCLGRGDQDWDQYPLAR
jgi:GNAT superfamily N-acetyltransferase